MGVITVPASGRVYIDANTVIYAVERIEPYSAMLEPLWQAAHEAQVSLVTSELTWLETLTKPLRDHNTHLENVFRAFLSADEITLIAATIPIWEQAARLRGLGLKTPDALHAATGIAVGCSLFVTNDPIFQRVTALPVTVLNQLLNS
ncbi:MAG TPA: type II toxin-antitoxin system VapC family toxin [Roseiflexaceae bacterium]|nr:type II toxin-antitoxin system VapC family toxin [Roseiflexaceae bacterium]